MNNDKNKNIMYIYIYIYIHTHMYNYNDMYVTAGLRRTQKPRGPQPPAVRQASVGGSNVNSQASKPRPPPPATTIRQSPRAAAACPDLVKALSLPPLPSLPPYPCQRPRERTEPWIAVDWGGLPLSIPAT